ncbi:MAG: hypothetical protein K2X11_02215, partial [Acetobacteraceae bacterium]|nr:hypothetical protein [Acetobacteraceae bacterium]
MVAPIRGYGFAGGRRTDARPAGRFILREDAGSARAAAETAALCGPSPLLLLQEAASPAERDRRALARGRA